MYKPNFSIAVNSTKTQLPQTFDVRDYDVCVSDISLKSLCNIPGCVVVVKADDNAYDVDIPEANCSTPESILDILVEKLSFYAYIRLDVHKHLMFSCHKGVSKIIFPYTLACILGLGQFEVPGDFKAKFAVDHCVFLRRIFVASHIAQPTVVNGKFIPLIYCGSPDNSVAVPTYFPVSLCQLSEIEIKLVCLNRHRLRGQQPIQALLTVMHMSRNPRFLHCCPK